MSIELHRDPQHACLMFTDLVPEDAAAVQANQFLLVDHGVGVLLDPGGNMTYNGLRMGMHKYFQPSKLEYILASHADPDIVASLNKWLVATECKVLVSKLWARFVPHFCNIGNAAGRVIPIPDSGMIIPLGNTIIKAIPAHFLHSEGNFHFFDPVSKILFSGDMGESMIDDPRTIAEPVTDFKAHLPAMEPFHRRIMSSNRACRYWVNMIRQLDVEWIVPQHGQSFKGKDMIRQFLNWVEKLECGVDLLTQDNYRIP